MGCDLLLLLCHSNYEKLTEIILYISIFINKIMESRAGPTLDEHGIPIVKPEDVIKEGYLFKQSRYLKDWRKYAV